MSEAGLGVPSATLAKIVCI